MEEYLSFHFLSIFRLMSEIENVIKHELAAHVQHI